jgi:hypothetical protein
MVSSLTYRTSDVTRWGGGQGSNLTSTQVDLNFWNLFEAIDQLEADQALTVSIDFISQPLNGNQLFVHLTNHAVLGPFTIPTAQWNPRGNWAPLTNYAPFDVVSFGGNLYLITTAHTSAATFNPNATNGLNQNLYILILSAPENALPSDGTIGMRLVKGSGSPFVTHWESDLIRLVCFVGGKPNPSELLFQYPVVDNMTIPAGLIQSVFFANTPTAANVTYNLFKTGASIGSITFTGPSPEGISISFPATVTFIPGDIITLVGPATPDIQQADISFSIAALLTA